MNEDEVSRISQLLIRIEKSLKVLIGITAYIAVILTLKFFTVAFPALGFAVGLILTIGLVLFLVLYLFYVIFGGIGCGIGKVINSRRQ